MKAAKFAICCMLTLLIIISTGVRSQVKRITCANAAASRYARADAKDVYFCEKKDLNYALFTIPYTYCVEILSSDGEWYYVKYAEDSNLYRALYGYCRTENLTPVENPPENVYLNMPITVTFRTDTPSGSLPVLGELNVTAAFYGTYYAGASAFSYVLYDGTFGYIYGANDGYPLNELPKPDQPPPDEEPKSTGSANATLIVALVLTGVAAAALLLLYFTSKRKYIRPDK